MTKQEDRLDDKIGEWFRKEHADDYQANEIADITFVALIKVLVEGGDVYTAISKNGDGRIDSAVREEIFTELVNRTGFRYDAFYNAWLYKGKNERRGDGEELRRLCKHQDINIG